MPYGRDLDSRTRGIGAELHKNIYSLYSQYPSRNLLRDCDKPESPGNKVSEDMFICERSFVISNFSVFGIVILNIKILSLALFLSL